MEHGKGTMFHGDDFTDFSRCKRVRKYTKESKANIFRLGKKKYRMLISSTVLCDEAQMNKKKGGNYHQRGSENYFVTHFQG